MSADSPFGKVGPMDIERASVLSSEKHADSTRPRGRVVAGLGVATLMP